MIGDKAMTTLKKLFARYMALALVVTVTSVGMAHLAIARGQSADDCPPGSTDPDCITATKNGK